MRNSNHARVALAIFALLAACKDPTGPNGTRRPRAIVAGTGFSCALVDRTAYCWGRNDVGQLGRGEAGAPAAPAPVAGGHRFRQIAADARNVCGLTDEAVLCWGHGEVLGRSDTIPEPTVMPLPSDAISDIGLGLGHACALVTDGSARCWGANSNGQRGDGTNVTPTPTSVAGSHTFSELSVGTIHTCGRAGGEVWCWGWNFGFALGAGALPGPNTVPFRAPLTFPAASVTAGAAFTCVVDASSQAWCWGLNGAGQLGRGVSGEASSVPVAVNGLEDVRGAVSGQTVNSIISHACALIGSGEARCWGNAESGRLGYPASQTCVLDVNRSVPCSTQPRAVETLLRFDALAPGGDHTCGLPGTL
jgi:alpha-tubulin suppressor-like RCC1 family protein